MEVNTLKDKPVRYIPAKSTPRRQRAWILSIIATLALLYYLFSSQTPSQNDPYPTHAGKIDWTRYAYSSYATDQHYLCNSLMLFDSLERLNSPADRLLFYPKTWDLDVSSSKDRTSQLLVMARDKYHVKLRPVDMYTLKGPDDDQGEPTWDGSINKLHAFREVQYSRIIHLDSDITLQQHLDELFLLPDTPVAMPRAYWTLDDLSTQGNHHQLSSILLVLQPSTSEADYIWAAAATLDASQSHISSTPNPKTNTTSIPIPSFATTLLNTLYSNHALLLPHTHLLLPTHEFRLPKPTNHTLYLGPHSPSTTPWSPHHALSSTKLIHFSDPPIPKPWIATPNELYRTLRPACNIENGTPRESGCGDRKVWKGLYDGFRRVRRDVCGLLSVPAPEWPPRRKVEGISNGDGAVGRDDVK